MEYHLIRLPRSEIEISVTIPFDELEPHLGRAAALISEEIQIEGFRRGGAAYEVVKNKVGEATIYERAAELAVRGSYPQILRELGVQDSELGKPNQASNQVLSSEFQVPLTPIGRPEVTVTKLAPGNELQYKAKVAVLPDVILPDYRAIASRLREEKKEQTVGEDEIAQSLRWLQDSRTVLVTVNRPAAIGDRVEIDFQIRESGIKLADGDSKNHPLVIGQSNFIPGFEEALVGMKAGERRSFEIAVPEDWRDKALAGKKLQIGAEIKLVQERKVPELDDKFAKGLGNFASVETLKSSIREGLFAEKVSKETQRIRNLMISQIATEAKMDVPDMLINAEEEKMLSELRAGVADLGMKWEDYLLHIKKSEEELRRGWRDEAERRVRIALCLAEIARIEQIRPSSEEIDERANQFLQKFKTAEAAGQTIDPERLREYTIGVLRNEKVFELLEKA